MALVMLYEIEKLCKRYKAFSRVGKAFRAFYDSDLSQTVRYKNLGFEHWKDFARVTDGSRDFHMASFENEYLVQARPTLLLKSIAGKGMSISDFHLVAILNLNVDAPQVQMRPKRWWEKAKTLGLDLPTEFTSKYTLASVENHPLPQGLLTLPLAKHLASKKRLFMEIHGGRMFLEWPLVVGTFAENNSTVDDFAQFCFELLDAAPLLFKHENGRSL